MQLLHPSTVVLLIALPDSHEAGRKSVASLSTWRAMRRLVEQKALAAGLPLLSSDQLIDHQGSFGTQLSSAVSAAFALGYDRVICVGNDCPDLSPADLRRAANALAAGQLPAGPDRRGGLYLVGFDQTRFKADAVAQLPWQTSQLADALRQFVSSQDTALLELPVRTDLNNSADIIRIRWTGQVASRLLNTIRQALSPTRTAACSGRCGSGLALATDPSSGRAPPLVA
ncbi:glycosyltransferase A (GT-A) superfamily protein (DUF2064 family) [Spirosoma lacussanchae]|uniref:DUF2064 domain-containing protein n=1 Tax=Spirosoma lacussanchae TaxID=1884249 RepID=UPI001108208F|nr:DUF2064 domain-containing protein [Spirosoma lacussanchae]